ncbi:17-beta-hydroxysteroid dehydrogenase type 6, partial [Tyto alba]
RLEMHNFGVKVSIIEPGYFKTMITNKENLENEILSLWERLPEETKTSYGEKYLKESLVGLNMLQKMCNSNLTLVTDCMEHALTSRYPRARYIPLSYLPSALTDTI